MYAAVDQILPPSEKKLPFFPEVLLTFVEKTTGMFAEECTEENEQRNFHTILHLQYLFI
jgi:hypothetical protein